MLGTCVGRARCICLRHAVRDVTCMCHRFSGTLSVPGVSAAQLRPAPQALVWPAAGRRLRCSTGGQFVVFLHAYFEHLFEASTVWQRGFRE